MTRQNNRLLFPQKEQYGQMLIKIDLIRKEDYVFKSWNIN